MIDKALAQLEALKELKPGWAEKDAKPPHPQALKSARHILKALSTIAHGSLECPSVCAIPYGSVQLEWQTDGFYFELEVGYHGELVWMVEGRDD